MCLLCDSVHIHAEPSTPTAPTVKSAGALEDLRLKWARLGRSPLVRRMVVVKFLFVVAGSMMQSVISTVRGVECV